MKSPDLSAWIGWKGRMISRIAILTAVVASVVCHFSDDSVGGIYMLMLAVLMQLQINEETT